MESQYIEDDDGQHAYNRDVWFLTPGTLFVTSEGGFSIVKVLENDRNGAPPAGRTCRSRPSSSYLVYSRAGVGFRGKWDEKADVGTWTKHDGADGFVGHVPALEHDIIAVAFIALMDEDALLVLHRTALLSYLCTPSPRRPPSRHNHSADNNTEEQAGEDGDGEERAWAEPARVDWAT